MATFLIGGLIGLTLVALVMAVRVLAQSPRDEILDRVQRVTSATGEMPAVTAQSLARPEKAPSLLAELVRPLSKIAQPGEGHDLTQARTKLTHAGYRGPNVVEVFFGSKIALGFALSSTILAMSAMRREPLPYAWAIAVVLGAIGFYAPNIWLSSRIEDRQLQLSRGLPDTLDLLVTCVEAGLGVEAALARVTQEIQLSAPLLASELRQTLIEINTGAPRTEAFRRLAERTGLDDLRSLSATFIQTEMFGTSVANALRIYSSSMRIRRTHRAEEKAATVAVKMMLPLILCILPSLFCVILGPAVVRIVHALLPALGNR